MTWTAPDVERSEDYPARRNEPEREMLRDWLDWHRATLLQKCAGLDATQLAKRAVPPSRLSLLGLVRHMSDTERGWVRQFFRGEQVPDLYYRSDAPDADFEEADPAGAEDGQTWFRDNEEGNGGLTPADNSVWFMPYNNTNGSSLWGTYPTAPVTVNGTSSTGYTGSTAEFILGTTPGERRPRSFGIIRLRHHGELLVRRLRVRVPAFPAGAGRVVPLRCHSDLKATQRNLQDWSDARNGRAPAQIPG